MLNDLAKEIHQNAIDHGWWEKDREFGSLLMLMVTELAEAMEEYRNGHEPTETYYSCTNHACQTNDNGKCADWMAPCDLGKPEGIPSELADCIIRILDYCGRHGIDIDETIRIKHEYNKTRPYRHGGKKL
jgi:NTP pyrophosphatase (non-canonical NTP hydrolase)